MNEDMKALAKNRTLELVKLPLGKKPVGPKWEHTEKYREMGPLKGTSDDW